MTLLIKRGNESCVMMTDHDDVFTVTLEERDYVNYTVYFDEKHRVLNTVPCILVDVKEFEFVRIEEYNKVVGKRYSKKTIN